MRPGPRTVRWRSQTFHFETFQGRDVAAALGPVWGVWWRSEFIGTMPAHSDETTKEFEVRSVRWLAELLR